MCNSTLCQPKAHPTKLGFSKNNKNLVGKRVEFIVHLLPASPFKFPKTTSQFPNIQQMLHHQQCSPTHAHTQTTGSPSCESPANEKGLQHKMQNPSPLSLLHKPNN